MKKIYPKKQNKRKVEVDNEVDNEVYNTTILVNDTEYKGEGKTILESLEKIEIPFFKTNAIIQVSFGEQKAELLLNVYKIKRLFQNTVFCEIMAKNLMMRLK